MFKKTARSLWISWICMVLVALACSVATRLETRTPPSPPPQELLPTPQPFPGAAASPTLPPLASPRPATEVPIPQAVGAQINASSQPLSIARNPAPVDPAVPDIKAELYLGALPIFMDTTRCRLPKTWQAPAIGTPADPPLNDMTRLCLIGFPTQATVDLALYDPHSNLVSTHTLLTGQTGSVGIYQGLALYDEGNTVLALPLELSEMFPPPAGQTPTQQPQTLFQVVDLWMPPGLPSGAWQVIARLGEKTIQTAFLVTEPQLKERILIVHSPTIDPLGDNGNGPVQRNEYLPGESVYIFGFGFPANSPVPVGLYFIVQKGPIGHPLLGTRLMTDEQGRFGFTFQVQTSDAAGKYCLLAYPKPDMSVDPLNVPCYQVGKK